MRHIKLTLIALLTIAFMIMTGCSTLAMPGSDSWSYNPQNYQGCTVGEYDAGDVRARWWDCKDKDYVAGTVDFTGDGNPNMTYEASEVIGSTAAEIRAGVEQAFAEAGVEIIPGVVDAIVESLIGG